MLSAKPLDLLKQGLAPERADDGAERVAELFRSRAELKKSFASLQDEMHRLRDRLKQQEGATQRVQELLDALEARLADPAGAYPALAFHHLRGLWEVGRATIAQFLAELVRQQEERERRLHIADANRRQFAERQAREKRLRAAEAAVAEARAQLADVTQARAALHRPWHHFRRRQADELIAARTLAAADADTELESARTAFESLAADDSAGFPGLSVDARRAINLAGIAYAELLCLRLARTTLVSQARAAVARREVPDDFGGRAQCEALMAEVVRARTIIAGRANLSVELKSRTERLRAIARYRSAGDTIPVPESIGLAEGDVLDRGGNGAPAAKLPNVLAEDTWDLFRILLR
jgi:hypothetical protein